MASQAHQTDQALITSFARDGAGSDEPSRADQCAREGAQRRDPLDRDRVDKPVEACL